MSIPITLLTGFLGAGKTTLLNALLREPAFANTAVLINEFGDLAIDNDLVDRFDDNIVETTTGCVCCSISSDVRRALFDLMTLRIERKIQQFDRVIVETTGLADPAPVINALVQPPWVAFADRRVREQFSLARVVTAFDIVTGSISLERHLEALKQIALADVIVLTKSDLADDPVTKRDIAEDRARLSRMNPGAVVLDRHKDWQSLVDTICSPHAYDLRDRTEDAIGWLQAEAVLTAQHDHTSIDVNRHGDVRAHCVILDEAISPIQFSLFLDVLKMYAGSKLLRIKGFIRLSDAPEQPMVVHGVQHMIHPVARLLRWPSSDERTRIVLIGQNLNVAMIKRVLTGILPPGLVRSDLRLDADDGGNSTEEVQQSETNP
jgi:G3E family GTPase